MRHELDGGATKCSCKGGGCKICGASNKQISLHNDLLRFGLSKESLKENLNKINGYLDKIDAYTLYEYITGEIDEEKFNEAITNYKSGFRAYTPKKKESEVDNFKPTPNPGEKCVFDSNSPWARCLKCNSIAKYMKGKPCLMRVENKKEENTISEGGETLGTTDIEN